MKTHTKTNMKTVLEKHKKNNNQIVETITFETEKFEKSVQAVLKRIKTTPAVEITTSLKVGEIIIDLEGKRLVIGNKKIELTRKEYEILLLLAKTPGRIFSREEILRRVWESDVIVIDRTVDVNMTRLRRKMEEYGSYIRNKPGFGYYFEI